jgi:nucleoside 2-deoxyribosyltransferase
MKIFISGSLRNARVPIIGNRLREEGFDPFDDWYGAGMTADQTWRDYEETRGRPYLEALYGRAATNIFDFDMRQMNEADVALLVTPVGRSGCLEFGYMRGLGKPGFVLLDSKVGDGRWDLMFRIATAVFEEENDLIETLRQLL